MNAEALHSSSHYSPQKYFRNALQLFESADIPVALQALDAAIVFSNNSPFYIHHKIRILYQLGALKSCSQLIIAQLEYLYKYGSLYLFCRTVDILQLINHYSIGQLQTLLHRNHIPYCIALHYQEWLTTRKKPFFNLARAALQDEDYELCMGYCELYIKYDQIRTKEILYMMARSYHMLGNLTEAKALYLEYLGTSNKKEEVTLQLIFVLMELEEYDLAIERLKELLAHDPQNKSYLSYLGECYYKANKISASIQAYETVSKYYPNDVQNLFNLSHAYGKLNKNWRSKHYYKEAEKQLKRNNNL